MKLQIAAGAAVAAVLLSGCASQATESGEVAAAASVTDGSKGGSAGRAEAFLAWAREANLVDPAAAQYSELERMVARQAGLPLDEPAGDARSPEAAADARRLAIGNAACSIVADNPGEYGKAIAYIVAHGADDLTADDDTGLQVFSDGGSRVGGGLSRVHIDAPMTTKLAEDLTQAAVENLCPLHGMFLPEG